MARKWVIFSLLGIFVVALSGCATGRKQNDLDVQGLRNQITVLESQLQSKDEEINSLKDSLVRAQSEKVVQEEPVTKKTKKMKVVGPIKFRPQPKHIQIALRNAGYNPGKIDGKMGKQTIDAIKAFQRANNLSANGKVDGKTWELLREHLYKKVK